MAEPMIWHDEADRLATWGTLDPADACMCRECVLSIPAKPTCVGCETRPVRHLPTPIPDGTEIAATELLTGAAQYCQECFDDMDEIEENYA